MEYLYNFFKYTIYQRMVENKDKNVLCFYKLNKLVDVEIQKQIDVINDILKKYYNDVVQESILISDICYLENILGQDHYIKYH